MSFCIFARKHYSHSFVSFISMFLTSFRRNSILGTSVLDIFSWLQLFLSTFGINVYVYEQRKRKKRNIINKIFKLAKQIFPMSFHNHKAPSFIHCAMFSSIWSLFIFNVSLLILNFANTNWEMWELEVAKWNDFFCCWSFAKHNR